LKLKTILELFAGENAMSKAGEQGLRPKHEPIVVARKPLLESTIAKNVLEWGTGGINIDGSRIKPKYNLQGNDLFSIMELCQLNHLKLPANNAELKRFQEDTSNVIKKLFSVAENVGTNTLEKALGIMQENTTKTDTLCSVEMLVENINTNLNTSGSGKNLTEKNQKDLSYIISTVSKMITELKISNLSVCQLTEVLHTQAKKEESTLGAQGRFPANFLHDGSDEVVGLFPGEDDKSASRFFYVAKASKKDRNEGLDKFEKKERVRQGLAGEKKNTHSANSHPTVKPTKLMQYLVRLVTPKGGTVLDPFMGSGSTGKACVLEGFDFIGIEMNLEYVEIAKARIEEAKNK